MTFNLTAANGVLKQYYTDDRVMDMVYKNNPFLQMVEVMTDFVGINLPIPVEQTNTQGRSATFLTAQARGIATNTVAPKFTLTRGQDYSFAYIDNQTLLATANDAGAFISAATLEVDSAINSLRRSIAIGMFSTGYGELGQIDTTTNLSGTTIQLANVSTVTNFEVNQQLSVAATTTSSSRALGSSGNGLIVTAVDRNLGQLTFGYNINDATNGIPGIQNGDILFTTGDRGTAATNNQLKFPGLAGWLPAVAPVVGGGDSFFGLDRSAEPQRLAGQRVNGTNAPLEEVLIDAVAQVSREGGSPDVAFCSYSKFAALAKALGSRAQIFQKDLKPTIGYSGIRVALGNVSIEIVPDVNCPDNRIYVLTLDTWKMYSLGPLVQPVNADGLELIRSMNLDAYEWRWVSYAALGCRAPGWNAVISV